MHILKKMVIAGAAFALSAGVALADVDVTVEGNGPGSQNVVGVVLANQTSVSQNTTTNNTTYVVNEASTGNNTVGGNQGSVDLTTGAAKATTTVVNVGGGNGAIVGDECGCSQNVTIDVSSNGPKSKNAVGVVVLEKTSVKQSSKTNNKTMVYNAAETGNNTVKYNQGSVTVDSGPATAKTTVWNVGGFNFVQL